MPKKTKALPAPAEQKKFAKQFKKHQWKEFCQSPAFLAAVETDLRRAESIVADMLRDVWIEPNEDFEIY